MISKQMKIVNNSLSFVKRGKSRREHTNSKSGPQSRQNRSAFLSQNPVQLYPERGPQATPQAWRENKNMQVSTLKTNPILNNPNDPVKQKNKKNMQKAM